MEQMGFKIAELFALLTVSSCVVLVILIGIIFWLLSGFKKRIIKHSENELSEFKRQIELYRNQYSAEIEEVLDKCNGCQNRLTQISKVLIKHKKLLDMDASELGNVLDKIEDFKSLTEAIESRFHRLEKKINLLDIEHET
jgi:biopolymer transport protein ExbB/TolQ